MLEKTKTKDEFAPNAPEVKDEAEELLKKYYKEHKSVTDPLPKRPNLLSWHKYPNGTIVLVDGTSGRKLVFPPEEAIAKAQQEEQAEDAEQAALDAEAEASEAEAQALAAEAKAKAAREKANKTPFAYIKKATKEEARKKAEAEAKAKAGK